MNIRVKSYLSRGEAAEQAQEPQGAEEPEEGKGGGRGLEQAICICRAGDAAAGPKAGAAQNRTLAPS